MSSLAQTLIHTLEARAKNEKRMPNRLWRQNEADFAKALFEGLYCAVLGGADLSEFTVNEAFWFGVPFFEAAADCGSLLCRAWLDSLPGYAQLDLETAYEYHGAAMASAEKVQAQLAVREALQQAESLRDEKNALQQSAREPLRDNIPHSPGPLWL